MPKDCVFCAVVAGAEHDNVYRDEDVVAFLDHAPVIPGHTLVVTTTHYDTLDDLPDDALAALFKAVRRVSIAQQKALGAEGSLTLSNTRISQSVPHVHVHVVPRRKGDGLFSKTFQWIRRPYPSETAIAEAQRAIQSALAPA
jgi:histidine triad (HIT) family protein